MNKTRSFNILGKARNPVMRSFAAFAPAKQSPETRSCTAVSEVFVISAGPICRQPLERQEIEFQRLAEEAG
jgi:hypothetical protein